MAKRPSSFAAASFAPPGVEPEEEEEDDDTPRGANDDDDESKSKSFLEESKHSENALATAFQYSSADSGNALCAWPPVVLEKSSRFSFGSIGAQTPTERPRLPHFLLNAMSSSSLRTARKMMASPCGRFKRLAIAAAKAAQCCWSYTKSEPTTQSKRASSGKRLSLIHI